MTITEQLKNSRERVEEILKGNREARDDDLALYFDYLVRYAGIDRQLLAIIYKQIRGRDVPEFKSLSRLRRKIQSEGLYPGTRQLRRQEEEKEVREYIGGESG